MNIKEFLSKEWKYVIGMIIVLTVVAIGWYEYREHKAVPMATVQSVNYAEIARALGTLKPNATPAEVRYITDRITEVKQSPPQIVYVSQDQRASDVKAQELTKKDGGDIVIKETTSPVTNSFYSVHTEKSKKIKAGFTVLDEKVYVNLGYQQGKNEVIVHYSPTTQKSGATYMRTLVEWD